MKSDGGQYSFSEVTAIAACSVHTAYTAYSSIVTPAHSGTAPSQSFPIRPIRALECEIVIYSRLTVINKAFQGLQEV
jgi:hypothetical protein